MAREYFCAYHSLIESLTPYGDAECGRLFRAALEYSATGREEEFRGNERYIWPTIRQMIDRDKAAYDAKCEQNRQNRLQCPSTNVNDRKRPSTNVNDRGKEKEKEKEEEKDKTKSNPPIVPPGDVRFERFWAEYPKKVGKQAAKKAFDKAIKQADIETLLTAIARQKCSAQWSRDNGQYIPNPTTWLNQGRWEDEWAGGRAGTKTVSERGNSNGFAELVLSGELPDEQMKGW